MSDEEELFDDVAQDDDEDQGEEERAEGAGEEEEGSLVDSSEEEEEGQDEYEKDDFIVDEEDDEAEQQASEDEVRESRKKKKKKKRDRELIPDEDDYALLEENDSSFKRPQRKRIKARDEDKPQTAQEMAQYFGGDDEAAGIEDDVEDEQGYQDEPEQFGEDYEDEGDEMDGFIDDGDGQLRRPKRRGRTDGIAADALEEAADIFGNVDLLLQEYETKKAERQGLLDGHDRDTLEEPDEEEFGSDDEAYHRKEEAARERRLKKALEVLDPEMVARRHLLPQDQSIAEKDMPERFQLLGRIMEEPLDYSQASRWIYDQLLGRGAPNRCEKIILEEGWCEVDDVRVQGERELQGRDNLGSQNLDLTGRRGVLKGRSNEQIGQWRDDDQAQLNVREQIASVLKMIHGKHFEVPFIAMYRKEMCGDLLSGRPQDMPQVTQAEEAVPGAKGGLSYPVGVVQAKHRRIRCWHLLWGVYEWSLKYKQLSKRKEARLRVYQAALDKLDPTYEEQSKAIEKCIEALNEAWSMETIEDVEQKFNLAMDALPSAEAQLMRLSLSENGRPVPKRHIKSSTKYSLWKHLNIGRFLSEFTLTAEEFAECLENSFKQREPEDPKQDPQALAADFIDPDELPTPQDVLKAAKLMAATELVAEPTVRNCIRELYQRYARVSSEPTEVGDKTIDPVHKYGLVKRLRGKPITEFKGDSFLRLACAEKEALLSVTMEITKADMEEKLLSELTELYMTSNVSRMAMEWNALRKDVLKEAGNRLFPVFEREFRSKLLMEAKEDGLQQYADKLWSIASRPPLYLRVYDEDARVEQLMLPRIMAVCWGAGTQQAQQPTTVVMLDMYGSLVDILHCHQLSGNIPRTGSRSGSDVFKDDRKSKDVERLKALMMKHKPNVVVLGCSAPQCNVLKADLDSIRDHILDKEPWALHDFETNNIDVRFADESLARLWEDCQSARDEFPEHNKHIRRAIALGRVHIDPLAIMSCLCDPKRAEILSLKLYDLQEQLSREDLLRKVEQVMVTAVCQVGADLALMAELPWRAKALQFVPGLGPRKAEPVLKYVQRVLHRGEDEDGEVGLSRGDLLVESGVFQNQLVVYQNCAAFLRIRSADLQQLVNVLFRASDDSRIHPASIEVHAQAIAEAVGEEDAEEAMRARDKIARLQPVALSELAQERFPDKITTLIDIFFEFLEPYGDVRPPILPLTEDEVFMLLHGETQDTLAQGRLVEAKIMKVFREEVRCILTHSGAEAVIKRENFSSQREDIDMRTRVQPGDVVTARVLGLGKDTNKFEPDRRVVHLTTRSVDLNDVARYEYELRDREQYYHILTEEERRKILDDENNAKKVQKSKSFVERPIKHPFFHNISISEAVNKLGGEPPGSFLFRPNVRGLGSISLSICLHKDVRGPVFIHYDLKEAPRAPGSRGGQMRALSTPLTIDIPGHGSESYEDLDEVCARFVDPLNANVKQFVEHKKFKNGSREDINAALRTEKEYFTRQGMNNAVYCLAIDPNKPGAFNIAFITNQTVHRDHIVITPLGYYFRKRIYSVVDKVINEFKRQPHNPHKEAQHAQQAQYGYSSYGGRSGPPGSMYPPAPMGSGGYSQRQSYVGYNPSQGPPNSRQPYSQSGPPASNPYASYRQSSRPPPPGVPPPSVR